MAGIQIAGNSGTVAEVEANSRAQRSTIRPADVGSLGSYRIAAFSGLTTTLAAGSTIFSMRWTHATNLMVLRYLRVRYAVITGFTAAQELAFSAFVARNWTVADSVGTAIVTTTNAGKKRASFGTTLLAANDLRIAAAAAVTSGTKTLDQNPILIGQRKTMAAAATVQDSDFESTLNLTTPNEWPLIFTTNEGISVQNTILMGAAGTVRIGVEVAWDEVASY